MKWFYVIFLKRIAIYSKEFISPNFLLCCLLTIQWIQRFFALFMSWLCRPCVAWIWQQRGPGRCYSLAGETRLRPFAVATRSTTANEAWVWPLLPGCCVWPLLPGWLRSLAAARAVARQARDASLCPCEGPGVLVPSTCCGTWTTSPTVTLTVTYCWIWLDGK